MKKYYILKFNFDENDYYPKNGSISDLDILNIYYDGISLMDKEIEIKLFNSSGVLRHYIENFYSLPIFSEKIKDIFLKYSNEIESYKIVMEKKTKQGYYFINIIKNVDAFDFDKSEYEKVIPEVNVFNSLSKLVLKNNIINERNIFRVNPIQLEIIISDIIKTEIESLNLSEFDFIPIEEYTWRLGEIDFDNFYNE